MDISPKAQNKQDTIHRPQEAQEEGRPKCGCFGFSEKGNKILTGVMNVFLMALLWKPTATSLISSKITVSAHKKTSE